MGTSGEIFYQDGTVRMEMSDGSVTVTTEAGPGEDSVVLSQSTADGTVFTEFDAAGNPGRVVFPDGTSGHYRHPGDGTVHLEMDDGGVTVMTEAGPGEDSVVLSQSTADGTVFTEFDAAGNPGRVVFPDGTSGYYRHPGDGTVHLEMDDGGVTVMTEAGPGEDSVVLSQSTADGTVFTEFDAAGNPGRVVFPDGTSGYYRHPGDGTVHLEMDDGGVTVMTEADPGEESRVLSQSTADGTVFTEFDAAGNPGRVVFPDGTSGYYRHPGDGTVHLEMDDGGVTVMTEAGPGEDSVVLSQITAEGDVYSEFDDLGRPHHVEFADQAFEALSHDQAFEAI